MATRLDRLLTRLGVGGSIASRVRVSFVVLGALLLIPAVVSVIMMTQYALRYHALISQVERTAALKPLVATRIPEELWEAVAGNRAFAEGEQYRIVARVNAEMEALMRAAPGNQKELTVARRTMDTLVTYIDRMGRQFEDGRPVAEQEATL
ncbi:MAG: hypothetical protein VB065_12935, partial [Eubacteriales bacterium]|nr:hypothetical protein [Eubacteriales bacterium]